MSAWNGGSREALSAKAEGLFLFFNEQESLRNFGNQSGDPGDEADFVSLDDAFVFRLGLNYRFLPFGTSPYDSGYTAARGLAAAEDEEPGGGSEENGKDEGGGNGGAEEDNPLSAWSLSRRHQPRHAGVGRWQPGGGQLGRQRAGFEQYRT